MSSPAAAPASAAPRETRHALKLRHKAELKTLLSAPAKGIGAKKAQKDAATALEAKHAKEMEEFEAREKAEKEKEEAGEAAATATAAGAADDEELSASAASPVSASAAAPATSSSSSKQPSRAQQKKAKSAAKDAARMAELRAETSGMTDYRGQENAAIAARLGPIHQRVKEMVSDGHCLYRAVYDQLRELHLDAQTKLNDNAHPFMAVRQLCADYMRRHRDEFAPFMLSDADLPLTDAEWETYLRDLVDEQKAVWGGHTEVVAMSKMLRRPIEIYSAEAKMEVGEEFAAAAAASSPAAAASVDAASAAVASLALSSPASPSPSPAPPSVPLRISFHKHYFGLGNHYNSVVHDDKEEADEAHEQAPATAKA